MKKFLILLFISFIIFTSIKPTYAEDAETAFYILHKGSGTALSSENEATPLPASGLTRIAALLIITESIDDGSFSLSSQVSVSKSASQVPGSTAFIEAGETISAESLYKSAAIIGAGDAIYALAETVSGSAEKFVQKMNDRLKSLEIDAQFDSITGDGMKLTALAIGQIACKLCEHETYLKYSSIYMDKIVHENGRETELVNQNRLIRTLQGCSGLMTGSSNTAGYCGVFYVERNGCELICVTMGEKNSQSRFDHVKNELESIFSAYRENKLATCGEAVISDYPLTGSCDRSCNLVSIQDVSILTEQGQKLNTEYNLPEVLTAPISAGDCVGNVIYTDDDGNVLATVELTVSQTIEKANFFDFFKLAAACLTGGM